MKTHENGEIDRRDKTLMFESKFESGNLYLAQKVSDVEYNLLMQNDINTRNPREIALGLNFRRA